MEQSALKKWDLAIKVVGLAALIISGTWTLFKFRDDRMVDLTHQRQAEQKEDDARKQELNKFVFERQTLLYFDAAQAAATIATSKEDNSAKRAATDRFYQLYFGELVVVEDRRVELAMIEFSHCLDKNGKECVRTISVDEGEQPMAPEKIALLPAVTLDNLSLELAACLRSALTVDRGIDFGKLHNPISICPYDQGKQTPEESSSPTR